MINALCILFILFTKLFKKNIPYRGIEPRHYGRRPSIIAIRSIGISNIWKKFIYLKYYIDLILF